jgi:hypothetical protein
MVFCTLARMTPEWLTGGAEHRFIVSLPKSLQVVKRLGTIMGRTETVQKRGDVLAWIHTSCEWRYLIFNEDTSFVMMGSRVRVTQAAPRIPSKYSNGKLPHPARRLATRKIPSCSHTPSPCVA